MSALGGTAALAYAKFHEAVDTAIREQQAGACAALMIDVGELWRVDSTLGLTATDRMLGQAVDRLADVLRERDSIGQVGRYHLGCLLVEMRSAEHALLAADKIVRTLSEPFNVQDRVLHLRAMVGIGIADATCRSGDELLRRATQAVAHARSSRRTVCLYDGSADPLALAQFDLQADLSSAIENNELYLCYQPKVDIATGSLTGAEALLRWQHPQKGVIPPDRLVQVAEQTGLITDLTVWVLNTALRQCSEYRAVGLDIGVSINFSAHNLREPDIVDVVALAVQLWGVPGHKIVIELTETAVMDDEPQAQSALVSLKGLGLQLSMDDFGTGYSSMGRLRDLPLDELKIDMSFVRSMLKAPMHERIVQSMIALAHSLSLRVVAEGVEDREILDRLRLLGCDCIQGYYIGKPMKIEDFIRFASGFGGLSPAAGARDQVKS